MQNQYFNENVDSENIASKKYNEEYLAKLKMTVEMIDKIFPEYDEHVHERKFDLNKQGVVQEDQDQESEDSEDESFDAEDFENEEELNDEAVEGILEDYDN